jgi:hypothetical protein
MSRKKKGKDTFELEAKRGGKVSRHAPLRVVFSLNSKQVEEPNKLHGYAGEWWRWLHYLLFLDPTDKTAQRPGLRLRPDLPNSCACRAILTAHKTNCYHFLFQYLEYNDLRHLIIVSSQGCGNSCSQYHFSAASIHGLRSIGAQAERYP